MGVLNVVDRVETKYPFVRQFGEKNFNVEKYTKELLENNGEESLKRNKDKLKNGHNYLQKEIGAYMFDNYTSFLKTSESLRNIHSEFEELKTMLDQYNLCINSL